MAAVCGHPNNESSHSSFATRLNWIPDLIERERNWRLVSIDQHVQDSRLYLVGRLIHEAVRVCRDGNPTSAIWRVAAGYRTCSHALVLQFQRKIVCVVATEAARELLDSIPTINVVTEARRRLGDDQS